MSLHMVIGKVRIWTHVGPISKACHLLSMGHLYTWFHWAHREYVCVESRSLFHKALTAEHEDGWAFALC